MKKKNALLILCDQLRTSFLNVYNPDIPIPTPHIDELARRGVTFNNCVTASPVCAPARASMLTGRYVSDHGAWTNNVPGRAGLEFLPQRMNCAGYDTAVFGCFDHYPHDDLAGFQYAKLMEGGLLGEQEEYWQFLKKRHPEITTIFNGDDLSFSFPEDEFYDYWTATQAVNYLADHAAQRPDTPFYACVSFLSPHSPLYPPREVQGTVDTDKLPKPLPREEGMSPVTTYRGALVTPRKPLSRQMQERTAYAELIVEIDRQIGRLLDTLKEHDLYDNTTIIFTADHGDMLEDFGLTTKGPYPYRSQLFVPMIVSGDPSLDGGTYSDSLVTNLDVGATLLDIAGDTRRFGSSRSLLDAARENPRHPREVNYSEFCDAMKVVTDKRYTFAYFPFTGYVDLYDRIEDPNELHNLAGKPEYAAVEARFLKCIIEFMAVAKGVRIEAHDLIPQMKDGLVKYLPDFPEDFMLAYPISSETERERLRAAGLDADYNEFCKSQPIYAHYGVYWEKDSK